MESVDGGGVKGEVREVHGAEVQVLGWEGILSRTHQYSELKSTVFGY